MGDVVNLRMARKTRARAEADAKARANRALHGRTAAEKARDEKEKVLRERTLDGARIDDGD